MWPRPKLKILLDRPDAKFAPGEIVAGRLVVKLNAPETVKDIIVRIHGEGSVRWSESHMGREDNEPVHVIENHKNNATYVNIVQNMLTGTPNCDETEIQAGSHVYPFEIHLPLNIPNSIEVTNGSIMYSVAGFILRPSGLYDSTRKVVVIEAPHDLSRLPMDEIDDEHITCYCCLRFIPMGSMKVNIFLPTSNYAIGETIDVKISVDNKSKSVNVTGVELRLEQIISISGKGAKINNFIIGTVTHNGPFRKKDEIVTSIKVPRVPCSNATRHCSFIGLLYRLHVMIKVSGCHCNIRKDYPIEIGSKSSKSLQSVQQGNIDSASVPTLGAFPDVSQASMSTMPILHNPRVVDAESPTITSNELNPVASGIPIRTYGSISSTIAPAAPILDNYTVGVDEK